MEIRIPTGKGNGSSGSGGVTETNKLLRKLDKSVLATVDVMEIATQLFKGLLQLMQPLIKVFQVLVFLLLLPLLPLIMKMTEGVVGLIKILTSNMDRIKQLGEIFLKILSFPFKFQKFIFDALMSAVEVLSNALTWLWENALVPFGNAIISFFTTYIELWKAVFDGGIELWKSVFNWVVEVVKSGWDWVLNIGTTIMGWLKTGFNFVIEGLKAVANGLISLLNRVPGVNIPELAEGGIVTSPTLALIGEAGPEAVIPLGKGGMGTTININNPVVRNDSDIRRLADEVGRRLQLNANRGFS